MTAQVDYQALVKDLKTKEETNKLCADCQATDTEWASINLGVFVCISCSAVHRSLGTHVSKIRSLQLDEWDDVNYKTMQQQGNLKSNGFWECNAFPFEKPLGLDPYAFRNKFIVEKYVKQAFVPSANNKERRLFERQFLVEMLDKKGFVTKQGSQKKNWKRRYCVLFEDSLSYFKKKEDSYPAGKLALTHDTLAVFVDENAIGKKFCIALIHPKRTFYMHLDTLQESVEWVYLFRMAIYFAGLKKCFTNPYSMNSKLQPPLSYKRRDF